MAGKGIWGKTRLVGVCATPLYVRFFFVAAALSVKSASLSLTSSSSLIHSRTLTLGYSLLCSQMDAWNRARYIPWGAPGTMYEPRVPEWYQRDLGTERIFGAQERGRSDVDTGYYGESRRCVE